MRISGPPALCWPRAIRSAAAPHAKSKQLGVPHVFSVRDGDHGSHVVPQFEQKILPFFSQNLSFEQSGPARR